ncbi:hypothetical protein [Robinsoniella peoriensis]|uniref:hypothetical protein n=1 Tax=Robinsoniella peoriensis TaxID=180332 RepID=UPI00363E8996
MKLKGKTTIELIDVNSGEVTAVEEENMVTNALNYFFNSNPMGVFHYLKNTGAIKYFNEFFIPICPKILGGILLFSETIQESGDNILPNSNTMPKGYASNNTNPYEDAHRGSMNLNESMAVSNGYRFVWDFATSQGNGSIAAVALTSCYGGAAVYGSPYDDTSPFFLMKRDSIGGLDKTARLHFMDAVELNAETETMYSISYSTDGISIYKMHIPIHHIGLTDDLDNSSYTILEEKTIVPSTFQFVDYFSLYGAFYDGRDGYWYGFSHQHNGNGSAKVYWIKICKEDYSFTEGIWTLSNTYLQGAGTYSQSSLGRETQGCVRDGYYYTFSYSRTGIYKIAVDNPADITLIELGIKSNENGVGSYSNNGRHMLLIENVIIGRDFMILEDDTVVLTKGDEKISDICTPAFQWKQFLFVWTASYRTIYLLTPFLATINNFSPAVVKTADKTMKITYTLTEEPEEN